MSHRPKILIVENDDFLREILGNLLHKKGYYILNSFCVQKALLQAQREKIQLVILGTSCERYEGKKSIHYIQKMLGNDIQFFIINNGIEEIPFIKRENQIKTSELSIKKILERVQDIL